MKDGVGVTLTETSFSMARGLRAMRNMTMIISLLCGVHFHLHQYKERKNEHTNQISYY